MPLIRRALPVAGLVALLATACGGGGSPEGAGTTSLAPAGAVTPKATAPTASDPTSAVPRGSASDAAPPAPPKVPGYTFHPETGSATATITQMIDRSAGVLTGASAWDVARHHVDVGGLVLFRIGARYASNPGLTESLLPGIIGGLAGAGATVTQRTIAGVKVAEGTTGQALVYVWFRDGLVDMYITDPGKKSAGRAFVAAYVHAS